uniref:Uncharacterized protein LOC113795182 n=1 Tax=Dermatophagoides pteronyssinus TaxID=6956 RepID=A0A6P6Y9B7_DERPT|nr:uncharacterized protein LOC113795182 [Dermatophagoides pteronyssinus]
MGSRISGTVSDFWKSWSKAYLIELASFSRERNIVPQIGDLAFLVDNQREKSLWPIVQVSKLFKEGREAEVLDLITGKKFTRSVRSLIPFEGKYCEF